MSQPAQRVWFPDAVESLWVRGLGDKLTPELRNELKTLGLDLTPPLKPGYPAEMIAEVSRHAARRLFPDVTEDAGLYRMGEIAIEQFANSLLGKALFPMLRVFGPRRALLRMQSNMRSANNFIIVQTVEVAAERFRLDFEGTSGIPMFWKALADKGSLVSGVPRASDDRILAEGDRLSIFFDVRRNPDPPFPGDDLERWRTAPAIQK